MISPRIIAPALAAVAMLTAQTAQAQQAACIDARDVSDAVIYAMPIAYDAARTACANRLSQDGFIARRGESFIANYRSGQEKAWPGAYRFLKTYIATSDGAAGSEGGDAMAALSGLPPEALRPFVDALAGQMIAGEIKGESCGRIERGLELVSPLPAENVGGLAAFIFELADVKAPSVCPAAASAAKR